MRLWDTDHPYYCSESNLCRHESWADFAETMGRSDPELNLLFRWDWKWDGRHLLQLFFVMQRHGELVCHEVSVEEGDEPAIRTWLEARLPHVLSLWAPLLGREGDQGVLVDLRQDEDLSDIPELTEAQREEILSSVGAGRDEDLAAHPCPVEEPGGWASALEEWKAGATGAATIAYPPKTGPHTHAAYLAHKHRYEMGSEHYRKGADVVSAAVLARDEAVPSPGREPRSWEPGDAEPTEDEQAGYEAFKAWRERWPTVDTSNMEAWSLFVAGWCQRELRAGLQDAQRYREALEHIMDSHDPRSGLFAAMVLDGVDDLDEAMAKAAEAHPSDAVLEWSTSRDPGEHRRGWLAWVEKNGYTPGIATAWQAGWTARERASGAPVLPEGATLNEDPEDGTEVVLEDGSTVWLATEANGFMLHTFFDTHDKLVKWDDVQAAMWLRSRQGGGSE